MKRIFAVIIISSMFFGMVNPYVDFGIDSGVVMSTIEVGASTLNHYSAISKLSAFLVLEYFDVGDVAVTQLKAKSDEAAAPVKPVQPVKRADPKKKCIDYSMICAVSAVSTGLTVLRAASDVFSTDSASAAASLGSTLNNSHMQGFLAHYAFLYLCIISMFLLLPRSKIDDYLINSLICST